MILGINYPWADYGADFGNRRSLGLADALGAAEPSWTREVDPPAGTTKGNEITGCQLYADLIRLRRLGVECVRWFVFADGITLKGKSNTGNPIGDVPTTLPDGFARHFERFLAVFKEAHMQVIPVLFDHLFATHGRIMVSGREYPMPSAETNPSTFRESLVHYLNGLAVDGSPPPEVLLKGGRAKWILESDQRESLVKLVAQLMELAKQKRFTDQIYAWEVMNEPDLCMTDYNGAAGGISPVTGTGKSVPVMSNPALESFMVNCIGAIVKAGFKATIGFHRIEALVSRLDEKRDPLHGGIYKARMAGGELLPQFHYYPETFPYVAPRHSSSMAASRGAVELTVMAKQIAQISAQLKLSVPWIIGEFATTDDYQGAHLRTWPQEPEWTPG